MYFWFDIMYTVMEKILKIYYERKRILWIW